MTDPAGSAGPAAGPAAAPAPDPTAIIRSRSYVVLLLVGAVIGVPVAAVAYFFLDAVGKLQHEIFVDLPTSVGFHGEPLWWPLPWLTLSGLLVALVGMHGDPIKDLGQVARRDHSLQTRKNKPRHETLHLLHFQNVRHCGDGQKIARPL